MIEIHIVETQMIDIHIIEIQIAETISMIYISDLPYHDCVFAIILLLSSFNIYSNRDFIQL